MLRMFVVLVLLANGLYFAWSQGGLAALGWAPARQGESERLGQQIEPDRLRLLTPEQARSRTEAASAAAPATPAASAASAAASAASVSAAAVTPTHCLRAGLYDAGQASALRQALEAAQLPADSWTMDDVAVPGQWIIYTGKLASTAARNKRREELLAMKVRVEALANASLEPGLALGTYLSEEAAKAQLAVLARRGVTGTRVLQQRAERKGQWLRLPAADSGLRAKVEALGPALAGQALQPCTKS